MKFVFLHWKIDGLCFNKLKKRKIVENLEGFPGEHPL